jgi:hypothetical protein
MSTKKGVKLDNGKLRWDLLPLDLVEGIVKVLTFGANKYTDNGWRCVPNAKERYRAALLRHLVAYSKGEKIDTESGLPHIDHLQTNAMFLKYFEDTK